MFVWTMATQSASYHDCSQCTCHSKNGHFRIKTPHCCEAATYIARRECGPAHPPWEAFQSGCKQRSRQTSLSTHRKIGSVVCCCARSWPHISKPATLCKATEMQWICCFHLLSVLSKFLPVILCLRDSMILQKKSQRTLQSAHLPSKASIGSCPSQKNETWVNLTLKSILQELRWAKSQKRSILNRILWQQSKPGTSGHISGTIY